MKKLLTASTLLLASLLPGIGSAEPGALAPGVASSAPAANGPQATYFVNITNQDTAAAFLTMYLDGKTPYGAPYQTVKTGEWHVDFYPPASFINMQIACYPNGPAIPGVGGNFYNGQRLVIPPGTCSAAAKK